MKLEINKSKNYLNVFEIKSENYEGQREKRLIRLIFNYFLKLCRVYGFRIYFEFMRSIGKLAK